MDNSVVVEHRSVWSSQFEAERRLLITALGPVLVDGPGNGVQHIGSTAIAGMPAKPIIDMIAAVTDLDAAADCASRLEPLGYVSRPHRVDAALYVRTLDDADTHHLHLTTTDSALWRERIAFRDAVRRDDVLAAEYRELKQHLLAQRGGAAYTGADKRAFVRRVLQSVGVELADGLHVPLRDT